MNSNSRRHRLSALLLLAALAAACSPAPLEGTEVDDPAWFSLSPPLGDGSVKVLIHTSSADIQGWSFGICHDPDAAGVKSFQWSPELATIDGGGPPAFHRLEAGADPPRSGIVQSVVLSTSGQVFLPRRGAGFSVLEVEYDVRAETAVEVCSGLRGSEEPIPVVLTFDSKNYAPAKPAAASLVPALFSLSPPVSDGRVTVSIHTQLTEIRGWSVGICHDPLATRVASVRMSDELASLRRGEPPFFHITEEAVDPPRAGVIQAVVLDSFTPLSLPPRQDGFPVMEIEYQVLEETAITVCDGLQGTGQPVRTVITIDNQSYRPDQTFSTTLVKKAYRDKLAYRTEPPESGEVLSVKLFTEEMAIQGWAFALCSTALAADVVEIATSPELERLLEGEPPEFILNDIALADPFVAVQQRVYLGTPSRPLARGPFPDGLPLLGIRYRVYSENPVKFCDQVGNIRFDNRITIDGIGYIPGTRVGSLLVTGALGEKFLRGDADLNGRIEITDPIVILEYLFLGGEPLHCLDAADANDVGGVDISDPIFLLYFLFLGGPPPPSPFPEPGAELSPETALGCERGL